MATTYPQVNLRRLNQAVQRSPLTKRGVAHLLGIHESTLSGWLSNHRRPSLQNLEKLADVLDVPVEHLTHGGKQ